MLQQQHRLHKSELLQLLMCHVRHSPRAANNFSQGGSDICLICGHACTGILVGTLGVSGYKDAIDSIRGLAKKAGKKTYTMLMGKPNPAKLANFPEVEIFVMVADPQGMILDSKEYYAPIITPYEAYMAFSGDLEWNGDYSLDFSSLQVRADSSQVSC